MKFILTDNQSYDLSFLEKYQHSTAGKKITFHQELSPADITAIEAHINEMTQAERDALKVKEEQRQTYKTDRDNALQAITHDFSDGRIMQVRPQDLSNLQLAVSLNVNQEWVMKDNTVVIVTPIEMQTALNNGIAQGNIIWKTYTDKVKAL